MDRRNFKEVNEPSTSFSCSDEHDYVWDTMDDDELALFLEDTKETLTKKEDVNKLEIIPFKSSDSRKLKRFYENVLERDTNDIDFHSYRDSGVMNIEEDFKKSETECNSEIMESENKKVEDVQPTDGTLEKDQLEEAIDGVSKIKLTDDGLKLMDTAQDSVNILDEHKSETVDQEDVAHESDSAVEVFVDARDTLYDAVKDKDNDNESIVVVESDSSEGGFIEGHRDSGNLEHIGDIKDVDEDKGSINDELPVVKEQVKGNREKGDGEDGSEADGEEKKESSSSKDNDGEKEKVEEEVKLDDDEDRSKPQYIPKGKRYYSHDDRTTAQSSDEEIEDVGTKTVESDKPVKSQVKSRKPGYADGRWKHDKYNEALQSPKSREEIEQKYGYEMRGEMNAPRGRRGRRYGRNKGPYVSTSAGRGVTFAPSGEDESHWPSGDCQKVNRDDNDDIAIKHDKDLDQSGQRERRRGGNRESSSSRSYDTRNKRTVQEDYGRSGRNADQGQSDRNRDFINRKPQFRYEKDRRSEQESQYRNTEDQRSKNIRYSSQSKRELPETTINADTVIKSTGSEREDNNNRSANSGSDGYYHNRGNNGQGRRGYSSGGGRGYHPRGLGGKHFDRKMRKLRTEDVGYNNEENASQVEMHAGTSEGELPVGTQSQLYTEQPIAYIAPYQIMGNPTHPTPNASSLNFAPAPTGLRPAAVMAPLYPVPQMASQVYRSRIATPTEIFPSRISSRPPPLSPHPNAYQSHTGVTYYNTQSQFSQRPAPTKRVKTAIPIVPPPEPDQENGSEQDASEYCDTKNY